MTKIGVISGSGLDDPDILKDPQIIEIETQYGHPSSSLKVGTIAGVEAALLSRHGRNHQISPTHVNNRANIAALKEVGVTHIISTTACGSLRAEIERGHLVVLDQFIDFTRFRDNTFYDSFTEAPHHTAMADPFDGDLRERFVQAAVALGLPVHKSGCVVTIEGPRFSTRAESHMFRLWGADVINMTIAPEAMLANEAEIPYATVSMSTDYDCWKEDEAPVTWKEILEVFHENADNVKNLLVKIIADFK